MRISVKKRIISALLAASVLGGSGLVCAADKDQTTEVQLRYWKPSLSGSSMQVGAGGSDISLDNTLGMDGKKVPQFDIQTLTPRGDRTLFRVGYVQTKYSGEKMINGSVTFNGTTYTDVKVKSSLDLKYARIGWLRYLNKSGPESKTKTFLVTELKVFSMDASLESDGSAPTKKSVTAPIPAIGFAIDHQIKDKISFNAEISGLPLGSYGHVLEGDIGFKYNSAPKDSVGLMIGYRMLNMNVKKNNDYLNFKFSGPYFSFNAKF